VFNYGTVETGGTPGGAAPWLRATFTQFNGTTVDLLLEAVNLTSTEFVSDWWFNVNPTILPSSLVFAFQSGTAGEWNSRTAAGQNGITNAGGEFDFNLGWPTSGTGGGVLRFTDDETALIRITLAAGLLESDFNTTSGGSGDAANVLALAHIQGITGTPDSSKVSPTVNGVSVPEPGSLALVGIAALAAALLRRRRDE